MRRARMRLVWLSVLPVAVLLALGGCADPGQPSGPGGAGATSAPATTAPGRPTATPPTGSEPTKTPAGAQLTVEGVVVPGVEPNCKVLSAAGRQYLIVGSTDVPMGVPVRIEGEVLTGVSTTCQQGTPLRVTDVQRR